MPNVLGQELDKLEQVINQTLDNMEKRCAYTFFVVNNHLLRHSVSQIRQHGPIGETWMYWAESAFGLNKHITMNPAKQVASIANWHARVRALHAMQSLRCVTASCPNV